MSMSEEFEDVEEMRHPGHPGHRPPRPPHHEPPCDEPIERMRETIEVQARTIRYLLSNYEALLRKVERGEHERHERVEYSVGAPQQFHNGHTITQGWWIPQQNAVIRFSNFSGGWHQPVPHVPAYDPFFSEGTAQALASFTAVPILTKIVHDDER